MTFLSGQIFAAVNDANTVSKSPISVFISSLLLKVWNGVILEKILKKLKKPPTNGFPYVMKFQMSVISTAFVYQVN